MIQERFSLADTKKITVVPASPKRTLQHLRRDIVSEPFELSPYCMDSNQKYEGCSKLVLNLRIYSEKKRTSTLPITRQGCKKDGNHETVTPVYERYGDHLTTPRYK